MRQTRASLIGRVLGQGRSAGALCRSSTPVVVQRIPSAAPALQKLCSVSRVRLQHSSSCVAYPECRSSTTAAVQRIPSAAPALQQLCNVSRVPLQHYSSCAAYPECGSSSAAVVLKGTQHRISGRGKYSIISLCPSPKVWVGICIAYAAVGQRLAYRNTSLI